MGLSFPSCKLPLPFLDFLLWKMTAKTKDQKSEAGPGRTRQGQTALLGADACVQVPVAYLQLKAQDCKTDVRIQL